MTRDQLRSGIFSVDDKSFESLAIDIFNYQFSNNEVYRNYCGMISKHPDEVRRLKEIPFLPISFFKTHSVVTGNSPAEKVFASSGTTGEQTSKHFVCDPGLYRESFLKTFKLFFGEPSEYCILALLPSYLERSDSSLVMMVQGLMNASKHTLNGFYLYDHEQLHSVLMRTESQKQKTILIGVSFALLDFAEKLPLHLNHTIVMETGGMKGRREEMTRGELHAVLRNSFHTEKIYSEYGMTELLSQAYSLGEGKFQTPPWMKIRVRDVNDPFEFMQENTSGAINIIDFANLDSCSFIATDDLGKMNSDGLFEVLGRMDYSDVRGCNLMWE